MQYKIKLRNRSEYIFFELKMPKEREVLVSAGLKIPASQWDGEKVKKSYVGHQEANTNLTNQRREIEAIILRAGFEGRAITAREVKEIYEAKDLHNIFEFSDSYAQALQNKRDPATLENYRKHMKKLKDFSGPNLTFEQITPAFLLRYEQSLFKEGKKPNYVSILMRTVKQMYLAAIKKGLIQRNPFDEYERPQYKAPKKNFLTFDELHKLEEHKPVTASHRTAVIYLLFGCYTGLRVSDWYNFNAAEHIHGNFIELEAEKNQKPVNIPITKPLKRILSLMKSNPLNIEEQTINEKLKDVMESEEIPKHITTHCGRHTFAITMCLSLGISSETAAKIMGITLKTFVDNYSQVTQEKITMETKEAWGKLE